MMNKFTKLLSAIFMIVALVSSLNLSAATKRVIVEDHTGTWCGYCVNGITCMDDLKKVYGGVVFPVAVHNVDPMAKAVQDTLANIFGINTVNGVPGTGYPSGMVDRLFVTVNGKNVVPFNPGNPDDQGGTWGQVVSQVVKQTAPLDLDVKYTYDEGSRLLSVTVIANVETAVAGQTAFNAIVIENGVVGDYKNIQWRQHNYYSKDYAQPQGTSSHPWYNKPEYNDLAYDYVLRAYLGGAMGDIKDIPATLAAGQQYTKSFSYVLPAGYKAENIQVIGAVQYLVQSGNSISKANFINANIGVKGTPTTKVTSTDPSIAATGKGEAFNKAWSCQNLSKAPMEFTISYTKSPRTPADWSIALDKTNLSVGPGGSQNCKVTITPGATFGAGDALVTISNGADYNRTFIVTSVSKEIERIEINSDDQTANSFYVAPGLKLTDYKGIISLNPSDATILPNITSLKTLLVSVGYSGLVSQDLANSIDMSLKKGVRLFLNGSNVMVGLATNSPSLLSTLNLSFDQNTNILNTITDASFFNLSGVISDPISDGLKLSSLKLKVVPPNYYYLQSFGINGNNTKSFLSVDGQSNGKIGARGDVNGTRFVVLSCNPYMLPDLARLPMMVKIIDWLENKQAAPMPILTVSVDNIDFGNVEMNKTKEISFDIKNNGPGKLIISSLTFGFDENFKFKTPPALPLNIDANQTVTITVVFTPKKTDESYTDKVYYESNDPNNLSGSIALSGKGIAAKSSVNGEEGVEGLFTVKAGPNPFVSNTVVSYTLGGNLSQNVNMSIIDTKGATIANLVNETKAPGSYKLDFSSSNLANGSYFLVGKANGIDVRLQLVINK